MISNPNKVYEILQSNRIICRLEEYQDLPNTYICGGCVRNILLGNDIGKDIDLFVDCDEKSLLKFVDYVSKFGYLEYGQYGSPRLHIYGDRTFYIDIVPFYNFIVSNTKISSIIELLSNFDITANAMGIDLKTGQFFDPVGGVSDINKRILRAVRLDFPEKYVSDSIKLSTVSVFWFRLLHYQQLLGFKFDDKTLIWIMSNYHRIKDEYLFEKYFFKPKISDTIRLQM